MIVKTQTVFNIIKEVNTVIRTRFAPSPTGFMHIGNLRTALYEYLIAKNKGGRFILRIEDTDQNRLVEGSTEVIYKTLKLSGLKHDEGPDIGGEYGPYIQSERKAVYMEYALKLVDSGNAYRCFCDRERLEGLGEHASYDRHCLGMTAEEIDANLSSGKGFIIRQLIPDGETSFTDTVYGQITVSNAELDDQVLMKSDGLPTYNFANVVDDHLMEITHVVRGSEYLSSMPKYTLLYGAFGWEQPVYVHLPLILNANGEKLSKRKGDASFEDLISMGYLPEAVVNYIALLGWSPGDNEEFFTLDELVSRFDIKGLSKSPSVFDMQKLTWMNSEYYKRMSAEEFFALAKEHIAGAVKRSDIDPQRLATMVQTRISLPSEIAELLDFIDQLPEYSIDLYVHKKMKTTVESSLEHLQKALDVMAELEPWTEESLHARLVALAEELGIKNGMVLWPVRTALSGKPTSPCGATELAELLGKSESLRRIQMGLELLARSSFYVI